MSLLSEEGGWLVNPLKKDQNCRQCNILNTKLGTVTINHCQLQEVLVNKHEFYISHLCTLDGGANIPYLGEQLKYCTPPTEPSFLPWGFSSSMPYQYPRTRIGDLKSIYTISKAVILLYNPKSRWFHIFTNDGDDERSSLSFQMIKLGKLRNEQEKHFTSLIAE